MCLDLMWTVLEERKVANVIISKSGGGGGLSNNF